MRLKPSLEFEVSNDRREAFEAEILYAMDWRYRPEASGYDRRKANLDCMLLLPANRARHHFRRADLVITVDEEAQLSH